MGKWVPDEPTKEMVEAYENYNKHGSSFCWRSYEAMLAAAPSPWRPIDEEAKGGAPVLVGIAGLSNSVGEAYYRNGVWFTDDSENHRRTSYATTPTHYMPLTALPPLPKQNKKEADCATEN